MTESNATTRVISNGFSNAYVTKFFFAYENVATCGKKPKEMPLQLLCDLENRAFDFYYETFARHGRLTEEPKDYAVVKAKLLADLKPEVKPEEEFYKAFATRLDPMDIMGSLVKMDALYKKVGFNETAVFRLLRKAVGEIPPMANFVMYRLLSDFKSLKKSIGDFVVGQRAFFSGGVPTPFLVHTPRKILAMPDAGSGAAQQLESNVDQLTTEFSSLTLLVKKSFEGASASGGKSDKDWNCRY